MTAYRVTASPVDDLDTHPPFLSFNVHAPTTADAVNEATRLLSGISPGLAVRSVNPRTNTVAEVWNGTP